MRKTTFLKLIVLAVLILTACSKEDNSSGDLMSTVPKGEIVPIDQRERVLIGYNASSDSETAKSMVVDQVWWNHKISKMTIDCGEESDETSEEHEDLYMAFKPDGVMYAKMGLDGTEYPSQEWEWASSKKEAINIMDVSFKFTELNTGAVTFASLQGEPGCQAVTWERFTR